MLMLIYRAVRQLFHFTRKSQAFMIQTMFLSYNTNKNNNKTEKSLILSQPNPIGSSTLGTTKKSS